MLGQNILKSSKSEPQPNTIRLLCQMTIDIMVIANTITIVTASLRGTDVWVQLGRSFFSKKYTKKPTPIPSIVPQTTSNG